MKNPISALGGKKLLLAISVALLLAAGCNSSQPAAVNSQTQVNTPTPSPTPAGNGY